MTHCRSVAEKCSPRSIEGSATFTIVASRTTMNWARQTTTRTAQRLVEDELEAESMLRIVLSTGVRTPVCDPTHTSANRSRGGSPMSLEADDRLTVHKED